MQEAEYFIVGEARYENISTEVDHLKGSKDLPSSIPIKYLSPYLDEQVILTVGGRQSKGPLILDTPVTQMIILIRHFHELMQPQGRLVTEGAVCTGRS